MGEMRDSDWSRENLLRSDWSGPTVATITTHDVRAKSRFGSDVVFYDCLENLVISYSK